MRRPRHLNDTPEYRQPTPRGEKEEVDTRLISMAWDVHYARQDALFWKRCFLIAIFICFVMLALRALR